MIILDYNDSRRGQVIRLTNPPAELTRQIAIAASLNREVVSATMHDEAGNVTRFCKGEIIPSPISTAPDAPPF
jgi:hypothetical protein